MTLKRDGASIARYVIGVLLCVAPLFIILATPHRADATLLYVGFLPTFVSLAAGWRVALAVAFGIAIAVFLGLLVSTNAVLAVVLMVVLVCVVAWSYSRGWQVPATYVATQAALAAVAAPHATFLTERPADNVQAAAVASGLVLIGGLWVAIVGWLLLQDMEKPGEPFSEHLVTYAVVLATLIGVETFIAMTWVPGSHVWWVLLTTLVVLTPDPHHSTRRAIERAAGTVVGAVAASVLVVAIGDRRVILALGALAALATCAAFMMAPYWVYASLLTFTGSSQLTV